MSKVVSIGYWSLRGGCKCTNQEVKKNSRNTRMVVQEELRVLRYGKASTTTRFTSGVAMIGNRSRLSNTAEHTKSPTEN